MPIWKDCGEDNHNDGDSDGSCDDCGYILVKNDIKPNEPETDAPVETEPSDVGNEKPISDKTKAPSEEQTTTDDRLASDDSEPSGVPAFVIVILVVLGVVIIVCTAVIIIVVKKKKK